MYQYLLFISFRKSTIVVHDKIYKVLTKFFIQTTVEVKFALTQMGFQTDVTMTQKKQFFLVTHIHFAILSGINVALSSFVPTWRIR